MKTITGSEMFLTADAEHVAQDLEVLGAAFTSGHRDLRGQAHAMAGNVVRNRQWIGQTYLHGRFLQQLVDCHPDWVEADALEAGLYDYLEDATAEKVGALSHHLLLPCPCMDIQPRFDETGEALKARILQWQTEGIVRQVFWKEGGLDRWHIEVAALPNNKLEV